MGFAKTWRDPVPDPLTTLDTSGMSLAQRTAYVTGAYEWARKNPLKDSSSKDERALRFQVWYCEHYDGPPVRKVEYSYLTAWRRYSERLNARIGHGSTKTKVA